MLDKEALIVVTGGAGFIGGNLVRHLNEAGYKNILVVDDLTDGRKFRNLVGCEFGYQDKDDFLQDVIEGHLGYDYVFHLGAISSTTHKNGKELMDQNYQYSIDLITACHEWSIPIQYASSASVYGNRTDGGEDPLNCYAFSKQMVDGFVRDLLADGNDGTQIIGLRYFNVYGKGEYHKDGQCSPVYHFYKQALETGEIKVFDVKSKRDFVHVDDVCRVHLWLMENQMSGIVDVGTGMAKSFVEMAYYVQAELEKHNIWAQISFVPFPEHLVGHYQYFTQAKNCLNAGYPKTLLTAAEGVQQYIEELMAREQKDRAAMVCLERNKND